MNGLVRSQDDKLIAGVSGALADRFNVTVMVVRAVFVLAGLFHGIGALIYLLLWLVIPAAPAAPAASTGEAA